jgi:hypothetical protein
MSSELAMSEPEGEADVPVEINPLFHVLAPIAAIAVTMVVRKAIGSAYEKATGHPAPEGRDPNVPFVRAVLWTAALTTTVAIAEVAVYRAVNGMAARRSRA